MWSSNFSNSAWQWQRILLVAPTIAGLTLLANVLGLFQFAELATLDRFFRWRSTEPPDSRIVLVTIDEPDIQNVGQWPIPNTVLVELLEKLKAQQPRVIGLALYRDLPTGEGDRALQELFASTPNLIGVEKVGGEAVAPHPTLGEKDRVGIVDLLLDADGKVRRSLLSAKSGDRTRLSFGLRVSLMYLEAENLSLERIDDRLPKDRLGRATFAPFAGNDGGYVRADDSGYQMLINYRGTREQFTSVSMSDVLEGNVPEDLMRDRVILVGTTARRFSPFFETPYSRRFLRTPNLMSGLVVHANITHQIISAALDGRSLLKVGSEAAEALWILFWSFSGSTIAWVWLRVNSIEGKFPLQLGVLSAIVFWFGLLLTVGSFIAFTSGWWIPVVAPLMALVASSLAMAADRVIKLHQEKTDLEILLQTTAEHSDAIAAELQQKAEATLQESYVRLTQVMEAMPVGVAVLDRQGKIYYTNLRAQQLFGQGERQPSQSQPLPHLYRIYQAGTDRLYPYEKLTATQALEGKITRADDMEIHRGNKVIPIESWGTPIYDRQGNLKYAIIAFQDITERQKAWAQRVLFTQELEAKNMALQEMDRLKDEFLKRTTHELNTPLNGIMGSISLILDGLCDDREEEIELLQEAKQSSLQLFGLIRELLEFDRARSEGINLEIKSIDLHSCLAQAIYLQLPSLQEKSLNLVRKYSQKTIKVKADPKKLKQVFINLLGNAIKFTDRGTITISTKIEVTDTKNSPKTPFAVVAIQDTGVGIDPKMRS
ncbi:MAG: CHASE2 domain-containing protein, partial [Cyanobacteriota bacterium]|nr:CHASE2 domain-containing protein [Cyanobacteriota bacterium]